MELAGRRPSPKGRSQYRPEIDGIRACAVLAVIANHLNTTLLPGGYLGVDVFFVISGYVITSSLAQKDSASLPDFIGTFYARRIRRLWPALLAFALVTSLALCLFSPDPGSMLKIGLLSLFGLSNISLYLSSTDYFAAATQLNPFTHTWSLGVEEQFYIVFPFLVWLTCKGSQPKKGMRMLFLLTGLAFAISLIAFLNLYHSNQPAAYFLMPPRFWEMALGCIVFSGLQIWPEAKRNLERVPAILILAAIVCTLLLTRDSSSLGHIAAVLLSGLLIASIKKGTQTYMMLTRNWLLYIGAISYSLYLWHWSVLAISRWTVGIHWWSAPFQLAATLGLASLSYHYIERPFRYGVDMDRCSIYSLYALTSLAASGAFAAMLSLSTHLYLGKKDYVHERNTVDSTRNNLRCDFRSQKATVVDCNFGAQVSQPSSGQPHAQSFYFVGSSHAGTLSGLIGEMSEITSANLYSLFVAATFFPPISPSLFPTNERGETLRHNSDQERIIEYIKSHAVAGDAVVIKNHIELFGAPPAPLGGNQQQMTLAYFDKLDAFTKDMRKRRVNVILIGPTPYFTGIMSSGIMNTSVCSTEWFQPLPDSRCRQVIDRKLALQANSFIIGQAMKWQARHPNGYFFEPFSHLCKQTADNCENSLDGTIYMYDQDHLNHYGGQLLFRPFIDYLKSKRLMASQPKQSMLSYLLQMREQLTGSGEQLPVPVNHQV